LGQGIVWFAFKDICQNPRGTLDYIEIARQFQTVIISDLPIFTEDKDNLARRFISLVDEFYDHKVNLILSAEENIENIYKGIKLHSEFKRTASRLIEMQSLEYLGLAHLS
jgi:cell division protein ZapE